MMDTNFGEVELSVIEPWDFAPTELTATVEGIDAVHNFAEIRLSRRVEYKGKSCVAFRMTPRKKETKVERLVFGDTVDFNLILIAEQEIGRSGGDFLAGWLNNVGLIASVKGGGAGSGT